MRTKINWQKIFIYYCTSDEFGRLPSYADVAEKFKINLNWIERVGKRENWVQRRYEAGKKAQEAAFENRDELIKVTEQKHYEDLKTLETAIILTIKDSLAAQVVCRDPNANQELKKDAYRLLKNSAYDLEKLSTALTNVQKAMRLTLGVPTEVTKGTLDAKITSPALSEEEVKLMDSFLNKNT